MTIERLRAALCAGRFDEAFALGESLLDCSPPAETYDLLLGLAQRPDGGSLAPGTLYDMLAALRSAPASGAPACWRALLEAELLEKLARLPEMFAASARLEGLSGRYGWMRHAHGVRLLRMRCDYAAAARELAAAAKETPAFWKAEACRAEALLCGGDRTAAFAAMDALVARLAGSDAAAALAWRGELSLWLGADERAAADLTRACAAGAELAPCWLAGARLRLGDAKAALSLLDGYLRRRPRDVEALVWRGEALRLEGRLDEALRDLDAAAREGRDPLWTLVNRGLARLAAGDASGARRDYDAVHWSARAFFEWKTRSTEPRVALEAMLSAARGLRRSEIYLFPLWVG